MHMVRVILIASLLMSLAACVSSNGQTDVAIGKGSVVVSHFAVGKDRPIPLQLGGKTFQVTTDRITWDRGGSQGLREGWGLLELRESPKSIEISLDGEIVATVAK